MCFGTSPLPHPATHIMLPLGGRVGERAGAETHQRSVRSVQSSGKARLVSVD